jgi:hypothetical protein
LTDFPNLEAALADAQGAFPAVKKSKTANAGTYSYSYADLSDVLAAAIPELAKRGIALTQDATNDLANGTVAITTTLYRGKESRTFGPLELPVARRDVQGYGSAITYGRRYHAATVLGIASEADDDGAAAGRYEPAAAPESAGEPRKPAPKVKGSRLEGIRATAARKGVSDQQLVDWAGRHGFETLDEIDTRTANELVRFLAELPDTDDAGSTIGSGGRAPAAPTESSGADSGAVEDGSGGAGAPVGGEA